jgi:hypothetical protein
MRTQIGFSLLALLTSTLHYELPSSSQASTPRTDQLGRVRQLNSPAQLDQDSSRLRLLPSIVFHHPAAKGGGQARQGTREE